jgi:hypothetical protein
MVIRLEGRKERKKERRIIVLLTALKRVGFDTLHR